MARGIKAIHRRLIRHTRVPIEERIKRRAAANRQITDEWKKMVGLPTQKRFTVREAAKATGLTKPTLEAFAWRGELRISGGEKENQPRVFFSQAAIRKIARKEGLRFRSQRKRFSRAQAMQALDVSATQFKRLTKRHQIKPVETSLQRIPAKSLRRFVVQKMVWIPTRIAYEEFQRRVRHVYSLSFNQFKRVIKEQGLTEKQKGTLKNQVNFFAFNRFLDWVVNTMEQGYTVQKLARAIGMKPGSVNIGLVSDPALLKQIVYFGWGGRIWIPKKLAEQIIQNHQRSFTVSQARRFLASQGISLVSSTFYRYLTQGIFEEGPPLINKRVSLTKESVQRFAERKSEMDKTMAELRKKSQPRYHKEIIAAAKGKSLDDLSPQEATLLFLAAQKNEDALKALIAISTPLQYGVIKRYRFVGPRDQLKTIAERGVWDAVRKISYSFESIKQARSYLWKSIKGAIIEESKLARPIGTSIEPYL